MSGAAHTSVPTRDPFAGINPHDYNGDWRRSFPVVYSLISVDNSTFLINFVAIQEWLEMIERDSLSAQTNPRRPRNRSDVYQSAFPEHMRRVCRHFNPSILFSIRSVMIDYQQGS
ncbi:hypothetical protein Y032_0027g1516 [Ancylostoma ceylanicum]|nr:hypothetical protein Y032_0027g1516 [Ancylostoma ceylanicum]